MKRKIWISKNNSNLTHAISFKALKAVFLYCQMLGLQSYMVAQEINFKKEKKLTKVLRTRKTWCSNNTNFTSIQPFDHSYYVLVRRFLCFHLYIYFFQTHPKKDEKFRLHLLSFYSAFNPAAVVMQYSKMCMLLLSTKVFTHFTRNVFSSSSFDRGRRSKCQNKMKKMENPQKYQISNTHARTHENT